MSFRALNAHTHALLAGQQCKLLAALSHGPGKQGGLNSLACRSALRLFIVSILSMAALGTDHRISRDVFHTISQSSRARWTSTAI